MNWPDGGLPFEIFEHSSDFKSYNEIKTNSIEHSPQGATSQYKIIPPFFFKLFVFFK